MYFLINQLCSFALLVFWPFLRHHWKVCILKCLDTKPLYILYVFQFWFVLKDFQWFSNTVEKCACIWLRQGTQEKV